MARPRSSVKTLQIAAFCQSIIADEEYRENVLKRARAGTLGAMEQVIYAYAYGKPKEQLEVRVGRLEDDLSRMSTEELAVKAGELMRQLEEAVELKKELSAIDVARNALTVVVEPEVEK